MSKPPSSERQVLERATLLDHDIRNAIADVVGGFRLAKMDGLEPHSRRLLEQARNAAEQLARLSQEALVLATGNEELLATPSAALDLMHFVEIIRTRWSAHGGDDGGGLHLQLAKDLPGIIGVDAHALERILANLIGNAFKYGVSGRAEMHVGMLAQETLCFSVIDDGPGFSDAAKSHLFEFAARDDDNTAPGSGHGLHIANQLTRELGGHLTVSSPAKQGSVVRLHLPRAAWAPGVSAPHRSTPPLDLTGQSVLIAEDNTTLQLLLKHMVETLGAQAVIVQDGVQALEQLSSQFFDLALVDIEMPRLSGLDLIRQMRRHDNEHRALPVLAVTAYVLNANRQEIYNSGADAILVKPVLSVEALAEGIAAAKRRRRDSGPEQPPPPPDGLDPVYIDRLLAFCDDAQGLELLNRLKDDLGNVVNQLNAAASQEDFDLLRSGSHVLIALAGAVGAVQLQEIAEQLNATANARDCPAADRLCIPAIDGTQGLIKDLKEEITRRFGAQP